MRKIEKQMCDAVQSNKDWQSANTSVHFDPETGVSIVRLHGNKIAEVSDTDMTIFDGGWQSVTTKSRLNALCEYFCVDGENVFQKDFQWYVNKFVGAINGQNVYKTETFTNGYIFAWDDYTERLTLSPYSLPYFFIMFDPQSPFATVTLSWEEWETITDALDDVIKGHEWNYSGDISPDFIKSVFGKLMEAGVHEVWLITFTK